MKLAFAALLVVATLVACGGDDSTTDSAPPPPAEFPECGPPPTPKKEFHIKGFVVPDVAIITGARKRGPVTNIHGYVEMKPADLRAYYEELSGVTLLLSEDEIIEAEVLLSDGKYRTYFKARSVCQEGSDFVAAVAREIDQSAVPIPTGSPSPL